MYSWKGSRGWRSCNSFSAFSPPFVHDALLILALMILILICQVFYVHDLYYPPQFPWVGVINPIVLMGQLRLSKLSGWVKSQTNPEAMSQAWSSVTCRKMLVIFPSGVVCETGSHRGLNPNLEWTTYHLPASRSVIWPLSSLLWTSLAV